MCTCVLVFDVYVMLNDVLRAIGVHIADKLII
jgi:hypothetical protein